MPEPRDFDRLGDLLPGPPASTGLPVGVDDAGAPGQRPERRVPDGPAADLNERLAAVWAEVVGDEVAHNARPAQLRGGRLVVTTSSSAWAQTLQLMSEMIIVRLNGRLGEGAVDKAVFRHAGWEDFSLREERAQATGTRQRGRAAQHIARPPGFPGPACGHLAISAEDSTPVPAGHAAASPPGDDLVGFSEEEARVLAEVETLPLPSSMKTAIRDAMEAAFARRGQDFRR
jgi:hypothetical protein